MTSPIFLTLIRPLILAKIKPYQNLSLIVSFVLLLIVFILPWFSNNVFVSNTSAVLLLVSTVSVTAFFVLTLPFLLFKKVQLATINDRSIHLLLDGHQISIELQQVIFVLNFNSGKKQLNKETIKSLPMWGNFVVVPHQPKKTYISFIPDEGFIEIFHELKIDYKNRSVLFGNTTDLLKNFIWMVWGAS